LDGFFSAHRKLSSDPLALTFDASLPEECDLTVFSVNDDYVMTKARAVAEAAQKVHDQVTKKLSVRQDCQLRGEG
jgi:hypothetical protein